MLLLGFTYYAIDQMKGFDELMDSKFKFEIKTAKDITTRLDDVKGMDEIKGEV